MDAAVVCTLLRPFRDSLALFVDYDGTLAEIVEDPQGAVPFPGIAELLRTLTATGLQLGVVSGRPVDFLRRQLPIAGAALIGQYGLERDVEGRSVPLDAGAADHAQAVRSATAAAERQFAHLDVESKGDLAVTVHWRAAGDVGEADLDAIDELAAQYGLWVHPTRMARELRVPVAVDKGRAVAALLDEFAVRAALFAGDDIGDLPAFDAIDAAVERGLLEVGLKVGVWSTEAPAELIERADIIVDQPAGFHELLQTLVAS